MHKAKEGDLYKIIKLYGRTFELRYGYYEEYEKGRVEPVPIYPNFQELPEYTEDGFPFVTQMQSLCPHGESRFKDGCCVDCRHYSHGEDLLGICTNVKNKKMTLE